MSTQSESVSFSGVTSASLAGDSVDTTVTDTKVEAPVQPSVVESSVPAATESQNPSGSDAPAQPALSVPSVTLTMLISDPLEDDEENDSEDDGEGDESETETSNPNKESATSGNAPSMFPGFASFPPRQPSGFSGAFPPGVFPAGFSGGFPGAFPGSFPSGLGGAFPISGSRLASLAEAMAMYRQAQLEQARRQQRLSAALPRIVTKMNEQLSSHKAVTEGMEVADRLKHRIVLVLIDDDLTPSDQITKVERILLQQLSETLNKRLNSDAKESKSTLDDVKAAADAIGSTIIDEFIVAMKDEDEVSDETAQGLRASGESLKQSLYKQLAQQILAETDKRDALKEKVTEIVKDASLGTDEKIQQLTHAVL